MIADIKPYPIMRDSDVVWLGEVPKDWNVLRGRQLFEIKKKISGQLGHPVISVTQKGLRVKDVESGEGQLSQDYSKYQTVEVGEFAMNSMDLLTGGVGIATSPGVTSPDYRVFSIRDNAGCCDRYMLQVFRLLYWNRGFYSWGQGSAQLGRWRLPRKRFNDFPFPVPPCSEQVAIARFLDWANGRLERAIRAKRKVIALLNEQRQAIIHRAVTRGLDPSVPLKPSGVPWLGDIPKHWEVRRAKQVCTAIVDCKNRTPEPVDGGEYVVVRTTNIRYGHFNPKGSYTTNRRNYEIWTQRGAPRVGDVFFTREAPVGEACLVPQQRNLCMGQRMMYFRPNTAVLDAEFLLHSIYGPVVRRYIEIEANGSTVGHLRLGQVSALPLLWCPREEQKRIVARVASESGPLNHATSRLEREIELLREYRTRLVADVVTGKLDVRAAAARLPEEADDLEPLVEGDEEIEETALDAVSEEAET